MSSTCQWWRKYHQGEELHKLWCSRGLCVCVGRSREGGRFLHPASHSYPEFSFVKQFLLVPPSPAPGQCFRLFVICFVLRELWWIRWHLRHYTGWICQKWDQEGGSREPLSLRSLLTPLMTELSANNQHLGEIQKYKFAGQWEGLKVI